MKRFWHLEKIIVTEINQGRKRPGCQNLAATKTTKTELIVFDNNFSTKEGKSLFADSHICNL